MNDEERLSPAEERVRGHLSELREDERPPDGDFAVGVVRAARWQRTARQPLRLAGAVLVLRDVEGLSYEEIASVTEAPLGSVKGRLHRARGELIEMLRNNTYDWELPR